MDQVEQFETEEELKEAMHDGITSEIWPQVWRILFKVTLISKSIVNIVEMKWEQYKELAWLS